MLEQLKMVRGAVAKKDIVPVLTHFHVYDGRIQGGNGRIAIDCQCDDLKGFDFTVPAERFLKAVDACNGEPNLKITPAGKLSISKRKFKALLPLEDHTKFPKNDPPESYQETNFDGLLKALRILQPFIAADATRAWSNGIWFHDGFAYATNNVVLARTKVTVEGSFILPSFAIEELLRVGRTPVGAHLGENALFLKFKDGMWMQSQLITGQFPESVATMIVPVDAIPISGDFIDAVTKILPFCPEKGFPRICLNDGLVATDDGAMSAEVGGFENMAGYFRAEPLLAVAQVATHIDFSTYPAPCYFKGNDIEGVLVGVHT